MKLMMRGASVLVLSILLGCSSAPAPSTQSLAAAEKPAVVVPTVNLSDQAYADQLAMVMAKPDVAGYVKLRQLFVKTSRYHSHQLLEQSLTGVIFQAMAQHDWQECQDKAATLLKSSAISLNGHFTAMVCAENSHNTQQAAWHQQQLDALIEAMWQSADGKSGATAFFATSTAEMYAFIRLHGFRVVQQDFMQEQGKQYNVLQLKHEQTAQLATWYFDVSSPTAAVF